MNLVAGASSAEAEGEPLTGNRGDSLSRPALLFVLPAESSAWQILKHNDQLVNQSIKHTHAYLLVPVVSGLSQAGHCDEQVLQSLTGGDSLISVAMQQPFQHVHKRPPVLKLSSLPLWMHLELETDSVQLIHPCFSETDIKCF